MSRNLGLQAARGAWITFLDDDDEYRPTKIAEQHVCALASGSPLVICGYEFIWPHRRRIRQTDRNFFRGDELLTRVAFNTPLLFHRREVVPSFDANLATGDDVVYALQIILYHGLNEVPCVPRALVVVYPQPSTQSAHGNKEAAWQGCRAAYRLARSRFSSSARRALLAHGRLERAVGGHGNTTHFLRCIVAVLRTRGLREWRLVIYSILARRRSRR